MMRANYEHRDEHRVKTSNICHGREVFVNYRNHVLVWLASMLCYANSLKGVFVFDDHEAIETNVDVRAATPLWSVFTNDFWGEPIYSNTSHKSYRPLTILTFRWNYAIGGLDPTGYHLVNIVLHGLNSALFVTTCNVIFQGMTSCQSRTLLASLLFVVHPIHTEAVANVVGRADLLCAFFYLVSFLSYVKCFNFRTIISKAARPASYSRKWLFITVLLCVLSLLSKEQGVTVLAICITYDILYICNINCKDCLSFLRNPACLLKSSKLWPKWMKRLLERLSLLMLSCIILLYIRIVVIGRGVSKSFVESDNPTYFHPDVLTRLRTHVYIWFYNAWLLLCPNTLCFDWSMDSIKRVELWSDYRNALSLGFVTVSCLMTWKAVKLCSAPAIAIQVEAANGKLATKDVNRNDIKGNTSKHMKSLNHNYRQLSPSNLLGRSILQAIAITIIPFIPASNLFFPVGFVIAERILYIPSFGFCILLAQGVHAMFEVEEVQHKKEDGQVNNNHKNNTKRRAFPSFGLSVKGRVSVYVLLVLMGLKTLHRNAEWQHSGSLASSGIAINPTNAKMYLCMGNYLAKKGYRSCEGHYREAIRLRPQYTLAWVNLGLVLVNTDRAEEAEKCYVTALSLNPNSANANTNMANLFRLQKRYTEAKARYKKALTLRPDDPMLYYYLGYVLEMLGKTKEASKNYLQSIAMKPSNAKAYFRFVRLLIEPMDYSEGDQDAMKSLAKAEEYLMVGLHYDNADIQGRMLYAKVLLKRGELMQAMNEVYYVLTHDEHNIEAKNLVGILMERNGRLKDARKTHITNAT